MIKKGFSHLGIFFLQLLSFLPMWLLFGLSNFLYYLLYYVFKYRKDVVRKNLINSFPEKELTEIIKIEKRFFRFFGDLLVETIKLHSISKKELLKRFKTTNFDKIEHYFQNGESVLACTSHYGSWEMGIVAVGLSLSHTSQVIYKPLTSKTFEKYLNGLRSRYGNKMVAMRQTARQLVATKNEINMFCFGSDQTPGRGEAHYRLDFLHQSTPVLMGLEKIAKQTNRPVFYFDLKRIKRGYYEIESIPLCLKPSESSDYEITHSFFKHLSNSIDREPALWLWSHKRWKLND